MNTKQLKQKILDLAIRGKLVPQDPNDEPASVLLERIRKEREQLVKEGKIKKSKTKSSDTPHYENVPFDIPDSWEWVRLEDVAEIARGGSPRPIKSYLTEDSNGINWIKIGDTEKGGKYINNCAQKIKPEGVRHSRFVHKGDFLLTNSMSFGRPYILNIDGCIHDGWLVISPIQGVYNIDFLYYILSSQYAYDQFSEQASGTAVSNLNIDKVENALFPIIPLEEQKRIVVELERWYDFIDTLECETNELQECIKQTKSKVLSLAIHGKLVPQDPSDEPAIELLKRINPHFTPCDTSHYENLPCEIPQNWVWVQLGLVAKVIHGRNQSAVVNPNGKYPIYGSGGIMGYADDYLCPEHSTIVGRKGTINNPILVETKFWNVDTAFGLQPNDAIDYLYFHYFCKGFDFTKLDKSTTLPSLTKTSLEQIDIPLPPLEEQARIVQKINDIFAQLDKIIAEL